MLEKIKSFYKESNKKTLFIFLTLYILVIISMFICIMNKNYQNAFFCIFALILFLIPYIIDKKTKISLPNTFEIIIFLFIFATTILGEIRNFYEAFPYWDTMLHTTSGFLCGAIGLSLVDILNKSPDIHKKLNPIFICITAICFSMTIGILWEFFEFAGDKYFNKDMQKDGIVHKISSVKLNSKHENVPIQIDHIDRTIIYSNNYQKTIVIENGYLDIGLTDTIKDLFSTLIGAFLFAILGFLYLKKKQEHSIAELFLPRLKKGRKKKSYRV